MIGSLLGLVGQVSIHCDCKVLQLPMPDRDLHLCNLACQRQPHRSLLAEGRCLSLCVCLSVCLSFSLGPSSVLPPSLPIHKHTIMRHFCLCFSQSGQVICCRPRERKIGGRSPISPVVTPVPWFSSGYSVADVIGSLLGLVGQVSINCDCKVAG